MQAGILICIFVIIGSVFGSKLVNYIPLSIVKKGFAVLMILISVKMLFSK